MIAGLHQPGRPSHLSPRDKHVTLFITHPHIAMKIVTLCFLLLTCFSGLQSASAQIHLGGIIDLNVASTGIDPEPRFRTYKSSLRFGIGAVIDYPLTEKIDLHAQIMGQGKGNRIQDEDFDDDLLWKATYLEIPLLLRYSIQMDGAAQPYVMAGPSIGFLTKAVFTMKGEPDQDDEDAKGFDFGLGLGAGAKIPQGTHTFFAEVRYVAGLVNVVDSGSDFKVKNRGLLFLFGVTIPVNL